MARRLVYFAGALASALVVGCGGGGDSSTPSATTKTGYFIDARVEGVSYTTSSGLSGITDPQGAFQYRDGDTVTFKLGNNITLGSTKGASIVTPLDLVGTSSTTDPKVLNIVALMLSVDSDGDPSNGIKVDSTKVPSVSSPVDMSQTTSPPAPIQNAIDSVGTATAQAHINATIAEIMTSHIAGSYSGSFTRTSGDPSCASGGTVNVTITYSPPGSEGTVSGTAQTNTGITYPVSGTISYRDFSASGTGGGGTITWSGSWNENRITGTWTYSDGSVTCSGNFSVTKQ